MHHIEEIFLLVYDYLSHREDFNFIGGLYMIIILYILNIKDLSIGAYASSAVVKAIDDFTDFDK